jgi:ferritin
MMISEAMNKTLNDQIAHELGASYAYLAMSCRFNDMGLFVLSERFMEQSAEERDHALKFVKFIQDVGGRVDVPAIAKPKADWKSAKEIVQAALDSELTVTKQINEIMNQAENERDYATRSFAQWFVDEQIEEVASMQGLMQLLMLAGEDKLLQVEARLRHMMTEKK